MTKSIKLEKASQHNERFQWFSLIFKIKGSVVPAIWPRVLIAGALGLLVSLLHSRNVPVSFPTLKDLVPSLGLVLGLLLVFRTNTAYDRFWEGRRSWGVIAAAGRNLASLMWVAIREQTPADRQGKEIALRMLSAFAFASKLHLRKEPMNEEVERYLPSECYDLLRDSKHAPLDIAFLLRDYLYQEYQKNNLDSYQLNLMFEGIDRLADSLGVCERILATPIPLAYSIHLKHLLTIYCLILLPLQLVGTLFFATGPIVAIISFAVFGIEQIGIEIENPFGYDANDLPLNAFCAYIAGIVEDQIALTPGTHKAVSTSVDPIA